MSRRQQLDAGQFNQRVRIERPLEVADGQGGFTLSWQLVSELWAMVQSISGRESGGADALRADVTKRMIFRSGVEVDASMRCVIEGVVHQIEWVAPYDTKGMYQQCRLSEGGSPYDAL